MAVECNFLFIPYNIFRLTHGLLQPLVHPDGWYSVCFKAVIFAGVYKHSFKEGGRKMSRTDGESFGDHS